jgi:hypothetical protein
MEPVENEQVFHFCDFREKPKVANSGKILQLKCQRFFIVIM